MNTYRLHWNDGSYEDIEGNSIEDAFKKAGYLEIDMQSLDYWNLLLIWRY